MFSNGLTGTENTAGCLCSRYREQEEEVKSLEVHHGRDTDSLDGNDATVFSLADIIHK